ncbi:MAG: Na+/H+ antiporter NhaC [Bacteroidetes bacterium]|nr:MAG: Na+/H+ antiporter NhaC [Bacteroidota bacterium]
MTAEKTTKSPSMIAALIPIVVLVILLALNVVFYGDNALSGANQMALLLSAAVAAVVGMSLGFDWEHLQKGIVKSIKSALPAILILLVIGALAGTWMISGIVPTMIYYGLKVLNPTFFLVAACIVSAIVSLATGSSWSTVATVGVALLGIGSAMGLNEGMIAGAIISGAYFGDKMSPLSDTTNLAPAMAGTDLFTHIRYMALTTIPTISITLIIFLIMGFSIETTPQEGGVGELLKALEGRFYISPVLFLVPVVVIFMIVKKVDALPALLIGSLLGGVAAIIAQPDVIKEISGVKDDYAKASYMALLNAMGSSVSVVTSNESINELLSTKGMSGMLNTIWLIVCAMCFGGVMEACGLLHKITTQVVKLAKTTGSLIATTAGTCVFFNATASDQYLAIVVPGRMFAETYSERGLKPENLSRTLEDSGTVTSVLFPWNTCGATQASVLGVATGSYWMYCFFNILSPIMTMIFGFLNIKIAKKRASHSA